jgi:hypothetical protein
VSAEVYPPEVAGPKVGKTAYWMRRKAQQKLIPHRKIGQKLLFTDADLDDILRMFLVRPVAAAPAAAPAGKSRRKPAARPAPDQAVTLVAKPPRRRGAAA